MKQKGFAHLIPILVILLIFGTTLAIFYFYFLNKNFPFSQQKENQTSQEVNNDEEAKIDSDGFFYFAIPKPLENLTILDLPYNQNPWNVVQIEDNLWFTGDGTIIEYSTKTGKLVSYSKIKKANCSRDIVAIGIYIYTSCSINNIDGFGNKNADKIFTGKAEIFKINTKTHKVEKRYSEIDGLLNGYNHRLYVDGDYIWVATFQGVGRINTKTNEVDFYLDELGIPGSRDSVSNILIDKSHVWVYVNANSNSLGGLAMFDKNTKSWRSFLPKDIKDFSFDRFDLDFYAGGYIIKTVPSGIQVGFRDGNIDGQDRLVEKKFEYSTGKWIKISERPTTGDSYKSAIEYIKSNYPVKPEVYITDPNGLTQIKHPNSGKIYQLDGRNNIELSPVIGNKRFLLTTSTIDVIDEKSNFRQILIKLGESLESGRYADITSVQNNARLLTDSVSMTAIVLDANCEGMGCGDNQKAWIVDLNKEKINKVISKNDGLPPLENLSQLKLIKNNDFFEIRNEKGLVFSLDPQNWSISQPSN